LKIKSKIFISGLINSELLRNASVLISGTVLAQIISILLQPFLRRYFEPEVFGTFSVYLSLVGILMIVCTLRYDDAVVLPDNDSESANLIGLGMIFNFTLSLLLFAGVLFWAEKIHALINLPDNFSFKILYFVPFAIFLYNSYLIFNYWLIRKKKFYAVSANKLIRRSSEGIAQIIFALARNPKGLVYGDIFGQTTNVATVFLQSYKSGFRFHLITIKKMVLVLKKYAEFPKYNLIPAVMSASSYLLPPVFITSYYSAEFAGYFDLSKLLLSIPMAFIAVSFSNVIVQKIAEKYQKRESLLPELKPVFYVAAIIGISEIAVIQLFGESLFVFVFGENWKLSGMISKIMVWSFAFNFVISSFSALFVAMRKIKLYSIWQAFYFISIMALLFFKDVEFVDFIKIYVIIEISCYVILSVLMVKIVSNYESSIK
jgi:O-antigen/teichoic acid export membrane protein